MRRAGSTALGTTVVVCALGALALSGCSSGAGGPSAPAVPGSAAGAGLSRAATSTAAPGRAYPVPASATPSPAPALATRHARDGWVFTLSSVRRVADDRIVVEGALDGTNATSNFSVWTESGFRTLKDRGGAVTDGLNGEFSAVSLSVAGDATTYLPVRDQDNLCLCTRLGPVTVKGTTPVYVVMSAPKAADEVTLAVSGAGTFPKLRVQQ